MKSDMLFALALVVTVLMACGQPEKPEDALGESAEPVGVIDPEEARKEQLKAINQAVEDYLKEQEEAGGLDQPGTLRILPDLPDESPSALPAESQDDQVPGTVITDQDSSAVSRLPEKEEVINEDLQQLLEHLKNNDYLQAWRMQQGLKDQDLDHYDKMLARLLESYLYFRLGEDQAMVQILRDLEAEMTPYLPFEVEKAGFIRPQNNFRRGRVSHLVNPQYKRGDMVYFYFEPKNLKQVKDGEEYKTSMELDMQLVSADADGHVAHELSDDEDAINLHANFSNDRCLSYRRDFFKVLRFHIPREINTGHYRLVLSLKDKLSRDTRPPVIVKVGLEVTG